MMDKMYSFINALSAAAVTPSLLPTETERDTEVSVGAQQSRASHRGQHRCFTICFGTINLHNMRCLHYCGSISMSWSSLLVIQMAKECVRISKHGEIIDHLNLYSCECSHHEFAGDLDLWRLRVFCIWRRNTHQLDLTVDCISHHEILREMRYFTVAADAAKVTP